MNDQLETDLRTALQERASLVPDASVVRLTALDYRPRRSRLRPPVAIGATAAAGAAAGAAALVISLGAGATNAFAGWTAKPTRPMPGQLQAAMASCQASQSPIAGLPLKLADTRGPFTFSVYADNETSTTCIKGPSLTAVSTSQSSMPVRVPDGQIALSSAHPPPNRVGQAYSFADGRTGAGVSGVTLVLDNGTTVQATVGNGWFVAWWPGDHEVSSARITTPAGVSTQAVKSPGPGMPPAGGGSSAGGGVTGSAGGSGAAGESSQSFGSSQ
jgi:hypothetical protein